jgi:hypothetical protein
MAAFMAIEFAASGFNPSNRLSSARQGITNATPAKAKAKAKE